jgi:uncharacterized membrane-anchored protein YitT (DUF2179 family)
MLEHIAISDTFYEVFTIFVTGQQFDIFMTKFNEAKNKYIPHMNTKANNKAKKHNYIPLDAKTVQKI